MDFDTAFTRLLGNEGGYEDGAGDPGGETNWGISHRAYPTLDIKALTQDEAKAIYVRDYWPQCGADKIPSLAFDLFDTCVNSGAQRSVKILQMAVGVTPDGVLGPHTIAAALALDPIILSVKFNAARLVFMTGLGGWVISGKGWARRIASNLNMIGS